jgi:hypothetical protein
MTLNLFAKWPRRSIQGLLVGVILLAAACSVGPPVQEMSDARQAISAAREAGASDVAPTELRAAEDYLDSALRNLSRKEYRLARDDALEAKNKAVAALATTERAVPDDPRP